MLIKKIENLVIPYFKAHFHKYSWNLSLSNVMWQFPEISGILVISLISQKVTRELPLFYFHISPPQFAQAQGYHNKKYKSSFKRKWKQWESQSSLFSLIFLISLFHICKIIFFSAYLDCLTTFCHWHKHYYMT